MSSSKRKSSFSEFFNKRSSDVWNHFHRSTDGQTAECQICFKKLKSTGGSTTGLHVHLRTMHSNITLDNSAEASSSSAIIGTPSSSSSSKVQKETTESKKRKLVTDYFKSSDSVETIVARMAALDGASFRFISESQDLRQLFKKSGYDLPKTPNTISKMVFNQAEEIKPETVKIITTMKKSGERFTLSLDEWTSLRNKRYMNINLHCKAFGGFLFKNLGLVKLTGSVTATAALGILRDHLAKFNITLEEDIISHTTDGASVMKKMGTYIPVHHQLCLAHGVQLAVIDTLYKTSYTADGARAELQPPVQHEIESSNLSDSGSDEDGWSTECDGRDSFDIEIPRERAEPILYKETIDKVRRLVRSIKKSPLKADALRAYVNKSFNENVQLQLDCRTRWSSMADMIGSFLKIKECVFKLLIDIRSDISFTNVEIATLTNIYQSLEVVKMTVLSLCRRDSTLYTADTALKFMLSKLEQQNTFLGSSFASNLRSRIKERRLFIAGILHYLHDAESYYQAPEDDTFPKPTSEQICDTIVNLLKRLKYGKDSTCSESTDITIQSMNIEDDESTATSNDLTLQEEFEKEMEKCKGVKKNFEDFDLSGFVITEKAIYDNKGERGVYLTQAYKYLSEILPTSVESERIFSSAGYFCCKIRCALSDRMIDALSFLRTHYQEKRYLAKK